MRYSLLFLLFVFLMVRCDSVDEPNISATDLTFKAGSICGWCAGQDTLTMNEYTTDYFYFDPCQTKNIQTANPTDSLAWNRLIESFDYYDFTNINVNSCDVCFDGCDHWVTLYRGTDSIHSIRYGYSDTLIVQSIQPFLNELNSILTQYRDGKLSDYSPN